MKKKKYIKNSGFTLVETLVAVSIFTLSILALMSVLTSGISNTGYAKKKMIAAYLAQEGMEYVRNVRDTYVLYSANSQAGWTAFNSKLTVASASCQLPSGCFIDDTGVSYSDQTSPIADLAFWACPSPSCALSVLLYNSATGRYNYSTGTDSGYKRKIKITQISANETIFFSIVSWTQGSGAYSITFSESLFNWVE